MVQAGGTTKPKIAVIVTEYRHNSHAEVIVGRLFGRFEFNPRIEVASLYVDQFPDNDMSREEAEEAGIPICATIREAVQVAHHQGLSGVLVIGEHGSYPLVANGQKAYPRRRMIEEAIQAMDELGICVPIFSDKHLSWNIDDALWIYRAVKERNIPFLGGSSIPHTPLVPTLDPASLLHSREFLAVSFGPTEDYGYHAWETLQALAEQRVGGETGVISVRAIAGEAVWTEMDRGQWPEALMLLGLDTHTEADRKPGHPRTRISDPVLMMAEYRDGLRGYVLQLPDEVEQWSVAWRTADGESRAVRFDSDRERPFQHFETLTLLIEEMVLRGCSSVPTERTLLTTGIIHYAMESLFCDQTFETPVLHISY